MPFSSPLLLREALPTTALILCRSLHAEALQATASELLAQGPYVVARVGFEPATLQAPNLPLSHHAPRGDVSRSPMNELTHRVWYCCVYVWRHFRVYYLLCGVFPDVMNSGSFIRTYIQSINQSTIFVYCYSVVDYLEGVLYITAVIN